MSEGLMVAGGLVWLLGSGALGAYLDVVKDVSFRGIYWMIGVIGMIPLCIIALFN